MRPPAPPTNAAETDWQATGDRDGVAWTPNSLPSEFELELAPGASAGYRRGPALSPTDTVDTTVSVHRSERAYLVEYDARYTVETSVYHDWTGVFGGQRPRHRGPGGLPAGVPGLAAVTRVLAVAAVALTEELTRDL